jgi:16S rRNA processing protein RimM
LSSLTFTDRTQAESLRNTQLFLPSDLLPSLSDDEFYLRDLKTYKVKGSNTPDIIGEVLDLCNYGAGDILEILYDGHEIMVPFKSDFVIDINEEKKEMIIDSDYIISMTTPVEPMKVIKQLMIPPMVAAQEWF